MLWKRLASVRSGGFAGIFGLEIRTVFGLEGNRLGRFGGRRFGGDRFGSGKRFGARFFFFFLDLFGMTLAFGLDARIGIRTDFGHFLGLLTQKLKLGGATRA